MLEPEWSRTQIQQWIKDGYVLVNGETVKTNYKVKQGDILTYHDLNQKNLILLLKILILEIVYEDEDVLVVNKPRGMVVHPAPGHTSGTLVNGLMYH